MTSLLMGGLWAAFVFAFLIPVSTVIAAAVLRARRAVGSPTQGSISTFLLIVSPTLAPMLWFISETLHESESTLLGGAAAEHLCFDLLIASGILLAVIAVPLVRALMDDSKRRGLRSEPCERVAALCRSHQSLHRLVGRINTTTGAEHDCATRGLFRPRVELEMTFTQRLDDDALTAVLLHEVEHVRTFDPLRNLIAHVSLRVNPFARLLIPEWHRWRAERELRCDGAALRHNANPLSLAAAIVVAARPFRPTPAAAMLTGTDRGLVHLRVQRLLEPVVEVEESRFVSALPGALLALELFLPHALTSAPIQQIHASAFHPLVTTFVG